MNDESQIVARWYASLLNLLEQADEAIARKAAQQANEDLDGTGWSLQKGPRGWVVSDESLDEDDPDAVSEHTLSRLYELSTIGYELSVKRSIGEEWRGPSGRWFTRRASDGRVVPFTKEKVAERAEKGPVNHQALSKRMQSRYESHYKASGQTSQANAIQKAWAKSAARMFKRHHGEHAIHRVEDMTEFVEDALDKLTGDDPKSRNLKGQLINKLRQLHLAMSHLGEDAPAPKAKAEPKAKAAPKPNAAPDPLNITPDNLRSVWENNRDEILKADPKISPSLAGSLAAARILNAVRDSAGEFLANIDAKVSRGESITDEEDRRYLDAQDAIKIIYRPLVDMSGYRPYETIDEHPEAKKVLSGPSAPKAKAAPAPKAKAAPKAKVEPKAKAAPKTKAAEWEPNLAGYAELPDGFIPVAKKKNEVEPLVPLAKDQYGRIHTMVSPSEEIVARMQEELTKALEEGPLYKEYRGGIVPTGWIAQRVRQLNPKIPLIDIYSALEQMRVAGVGQIRVNNERNLAEIQKTEPSFVFADGNQESGSLWYQGAPTYFSLRDGIKVQEAIAKAAGKKTGA